MLLGFTLQVETRVGAPLDFMKEMEETLEDGLHDVHETFLPHRYPPTELFAHSSSFFSYLKVEIVTRD